MGGSTNLETPPATPETIQPSKPTSENDVVDTTAQFNSQNSLKSAKLVVSAIIIKKN